MSNCFASFKKLLSRFHAPVLLLAEGIPFQRAAGVFSLLPKTGTVDIPCGFTAGRLFLLGCTVSGGRPLQTYGSIEIHYRDGSPDAFPLLCGFTLDGAHKCLSPSEALHLHASSDPYQHYLAIAPRPAVIDKIRLVAGPQEGPRARLTAITCETSAKHEQLMPLPPTSLPASEAGWITEHTVSAGHPELGPIREIIREDHRLSP